MERIDALIIGGGQAGLATSRCLADAGVDHIVIERGRVAERWRSERWDSLRLLTPNWQSRLPGFRYDGPDPDGYMMMPAVVDFLERYARSFAAPVLHGTTVLALGPAPSGGFLVNTDRGTWRARAVVIATGYCDLPSIPAWAARLPEDIVQVTPSSYRRPEALAVGGVLVVGASATGVQLADEIHASGRPVTIAVGRHTRLPRRYRGRDILWWLDRMGLLDVTASDVHDLGVSRQQPSLQLVGRPDHATLDLSVLRSRGVEVIGRATDVDGGVVRIADDLVTTTVASDAKLATLLARIDAFVTETGLAGEVGPPEPFEPIWPLFTRTATPLDLRARGIATVVWATGFRRAYPWLYLPVLDASGEIQQNGGVTPIAGLYTMGLPFMRRRKSAFIDGVGDDAREIVLNMTRHLSPRLTSVESRGPAGSGLNYGSGLKAQGSGDRAAGAYLSPES